VAALFVVWLKSPLKVIPAKLEDNVPVQVYGLGMLAAHTVSKIGFKVSGTLVSLEADQGDRVKKGQVLARLTHRIMRLPLSGKQRLLSGVLDGPITLGHSTLIPHDELENEDALMEILKHTTIIGTPVR